MRLRNKVDRRASRRRENVRQGRPSLEMCEPRTLMAAGFIQGYVQNSSNPTTVDLYDSTGTNLLATTTTNSAGYFNFNSYFNSSSSLGAGTYDVVTPNYTTSNVSWQTTVNNATSTTVNGNMAIQVTVEPLPQDISLTWTNNPYNIANAYYELNADPPYNSEGEQEYTSDSGGDGVGGFNFSLSKNLGNTSAIVTYCSDLLDLVYGPPSDPYTVDVSLTPNTTTLTANLGELGYLYNTYGTPFGPASPTVPLPAGARAMAARVQTMRSTAAACSWPFGLSNTTSRAP